jgi:hypothetical protein
MPKPSLYVFQAITAISKAMINGEQIGSTEPAAFIAKNLTKGVYDHMHSSEFRTMLLGASSALRSTSTKPSARKFLIELVLTLGANFSSDDLNRL